MLNEQNNFLNSEENSFNILSEEPSLIEINKKRERKRFSKIGWAFMLIMFSMQILALVPAIIAQSITAVAPWFNAFSGVFTIIVSTYVIGLPMCYFVLKSIRVTPALKEPEPITITLFIKYFIVAFGIMYLFNFVGTYGYIFICSLLNIDVSFIVSDTLGNMNIFALIGYAVIFGPIMEEILFRKLFINRMRDFGDLTAILISSLLFSLFHANFVQSFYAFGIGLVLAYIYIKHQNLKIVILLHIIINFFGSFVFAYLVTDTIIQLCFIFTMIILMLVIVIKDRKKVVFDKGNYLLSGKEKFKISFLNAGILTSTIFAILLMILVMFMM